MICEEQSNPHTVLRENGIESAIHSAFYPGSPPFAHGGIAKLAGTLCYYLTKAHVFMDGNKRTAALTAVSFLNDHGWDISYPYDEQKDINALAEMVDACAASTISKEEVIAWFDTHKVLQET